MTIDDLLAAMRGAFRLFDDKAIEQWGGVFRRQFQRHEGPRLEEAWMDLLASFKPGRTQAYPLPADLDAYLPGGLKLPSSGPALDLKGHAERKRRLTATWRETQGERIAKARGNTIAMACEWAVADIAQMRAWNPEPEDILLSVEYIQICEDRVVSSERNQAFGPWALREENADRWEREMAQCRELVRANRRPVVELKPKDEGTKTGPSPFAVATKARLAELAQARREGREPPPRLEPIDDFGVAG